MDELIDAMERDSFTSYKYSEPIDAKTVARIYNNVII